MNPILPRVICSGMVLIEQLESLLRPSGTINLRKINEHVVSLSVQCSIQLCENGIS